MMHNGFKSFLYKYLSSCCLTNRPTSQSGKQSRETASVYAKLTYKHKAKEKAIGYVLYVFRIRIIHIQMSKWTRFEDLSGKSYLK